MSVTVIEKKFGNYYSERYKSSLDYACIDGNPDKFGISGKYWELLKSRRRNPCYSKMRNPFRVFCKLQKYRSFGNYLSYIFGKK